eukprot:93128-Pelagomonas_calceolata.AAC.1
MMGTKENVLGVSAPVVSVLWVVIQRGGHFLLSDRAHSWRAVWMWVGRAREKESLTFLLACLFSSRVLRARSPCSSDAKLVGAGVMASCKPASLAL